MISLLLSGAVVSGILQIYSDLKGKKRGVYFFKPFTMVLIILMALITETDHDFYRCMIVAGLILSTAGDVFLMLPRDRFVAGLVSFFIAHLFYITAFSISLEKAVLWTLFPLLVYGGVICKVLFPFFKKMKIPVSLYMLILLAMAWSAWSRFLVSGGPAAGIALAGALLFVASDTLLAFRDFYRPLGGLYLPVMPLYFAAQIFLALSVGEF